MRRAIGWLLSWGFYWAGDIACRVDAGEAYQWLMNKAGDWQDWGGAGPWHPASISPDQE